LTFQVAMQSTKCIVLDACSCWSQPNNIKHFG
jgi:hypothetical protein